MFKLKRMTAIALSAVLAFSFTGCGSEDKGEDSKESKKEEKKIETIYDAFDAVSGYTKGSFSFDLTADFSVEDESGSVKIKSEGKVDGKNQSIDKFSVKADAEGQSIDWEIGSIVTVVDGRAYIDLDTIIKAVTDVDTEFGAYGLLLPEEKDVNIDEKKAKELSDGAIKALLSGAEISGEDGDFTAVVKDAEGYKKTVEAFFDWLDQNKDDIQALAENSLKSVDYKDYLTKLVDDIDDDLIEAADILGLGDYVNKDTIDSLKESLESSLDELDTDDIASIDLFEGFEEAKQEIDNMTDEEWNEVFESLDKAELTLKIKVDGDTIRASIAADVVTKDGQNVKVNGSYSFDSSSVSIEKPANAASLADIATYAKENPEVLNTLSEKITELTSSLGSYSYDDDYDYDYDDDDYDYEYEDYSDIGWDD